MSNLLQTGDVIEIQDGMRIHAYVPEKFLYSNSRFSDENKRTNIRIGEVRNNQVDVEAVKAEIVKKVKEAFSSASGFNLGDEAAKDFVESVLPEHVEEQFDGGEYKGEYLVIRTAFEGGCALGRDPYPDGHHVFAKKLKDGKFDPDGIEISFYQSGDFTNMILPRQIQPIRKMAMTFI